MKIIGSSNSGYIVEISNAEMSRMLKSWENSPKYGDEIDLAAFCDILDKVRHLDSNKLQFAIKRTRDMLESFEEVQSSINALLLFDKLSKPENENS